MGLAAALMNRGGRNIPARLVLGCENGRADEQQGVTINSTQKKREREINLSVLATVRRVTAAPATAVEKKTVHGRLQPRDET